MKVSDCDGTFFSFFSCSGIFTKDVSFFFFFFVDSLNGVDICDSFNPLQLSSRFNLYPHVSSCHYPSHKTSYENSSLSLQTESQLWWVFHVTGYLEVSRLHVVDNYRRQFSFYHESQHDGRFASASQDFPLAKWHFK